VLRLEYGDRITVTSVYPGYIRTAIHERSGGFGYALVRALPRRLVDRVTRARLCRLAARGHFDSGIARELGARVRAG
jgi:NAD(P)-dependent dehydrogenase (short-subunit alcohol dehydrogenase family)